MKPETRGALILAFCGILYSLYGVYSKWMGNAFAPFYQSWSRSLICIPVLLLIAVSFRQYKKIQKRDILWFIMIGSFGGAVDALYFIAVTKIPLGITLFLFYAWSTMFSYMWGALLYKEKITKIKILSIILVIIGLGLLYKDQLSFNASLFIYYGAASLAGVCVSVYYTFSKKISSTYSNFQIAATNNIFAIIITTLPASLLLHEQWNTHFTSGAWGINILFALTQIILMSLVVYGFKYIEAQKGSLLLLLEIIFGTIWGILLFHENPNMMTIVGGVIILGALVLPLLRIQKKIA